MDQHSPYAFAKIVRMEKQHLYLAGLDAHESDADIWKSSERKREMKCVNEYFKLEEMDKRDVLDNIFKEMIWSMRFLEEVFIEGNKEVTALSYIK